MKDTTGKILFYDIETTPILSWHFSCGKQVLRHGQLLNGYFSRSHIICIAYQWAHKKRAHILTWGSSDKDEANMLLEFDKLINQADVVIGKNSNRFDNKHINMARVWHGLPPMPDWIRYTDDLETQMRKYFYLPSYSLDYISAQLGFGGKNPMSFEHWREIAEYRLLQLSGKPTEAHSKVFSLLTGRSPSQIKKLGKQAEKAMFKYNIKDTEDTVNLWNALSSHFEPKHNRATVLGRPCCKHCGSSRVVLKDKRSQGGTVYQRFDCLEHGGYAGRATINRNGKYGKML